MPGGFRGQQQPQQSGRAVSNRLPNGKMAPVSNGSGWGFGSGMPMGGGGGANVPQASARQIGGNVSFAQSLSASQPATPLDPSEFPSLSGSSQLGASTPATMWSSASRGLGSATQRGSGLPLSSQQGQQDDFFSSGRLSSAQGSFRFGSQSSVTPSGQAPSNPTDEFPPLNRNANGEITGQDRNPGLMSGLAFSAQAASPAMHNNRGGNGLLNALSNTRAAEARSPSSIIRPQDPRSTVGEEDSRQKPSGYREDSLASHSSVGDGSALLSGNRNPLGAIGNDPPTGKLKEEEKGRANEFQDPLEGMAPIDKWGIKGLRTLMNNHPDYNGLVCGADPSVLGLNLNSTETISDKIYSLFDDEPPRPAVPKFRLPDCYQVKNVQPIEAKIQSFNEETLMWIFYSCPADVKQQMAAVELTNRNWRWHKKYQFWLTKDDVMVPQPLSANHEHGYYIVWDTITWHKDRRELTLHYADLETNPGVPQIPGGSV